MVQLAPGARVPQLLVSWNWPRIFTDLREVEVVSGLVTVTVPPAPSNKTSKLGETVINAPLPLKEADLLAAPFRVNFTDPFRSPPAVGWNVTVAVQLCPAASVDGQLSVRGKSARVETVELTVKGASPMLVSVVVSAGLAIPTSSVGNVNLGGVTTETATFLVSGCVTTACGRLKSPAPVPPVPRTIWSS